MIIKKHQVTINSKYLVMTNDSSTFGVLKKNDIKNTCLYTQVDSLINGKTFDFLKRIKKIILIDEKNDYDRLNKKLEGNVIFLKKDFSILSRDDILNCIDCTLYDNINFINVSRYKYKDNVNKKIEYIPTGFYSIDYAINDISTGTLSIVTGKTGQGKSTWVECIQNSAIDKGMKIAVIDGEHSREDKINNTHLKVLGRYEGHFIEEFKINKRKMYRINKKGQKILEEWEKDKFFLYTASCELKKKKRSELFELISDCIIFEGIKLVIIDNIMSLNVIEDQQDKNENQKQFVEECQKLCKKYNVAIVLVAHPKKKKDGEELNEYDISGSSDIPNYADYIFTVGKSSKEEEFTGADGFIKINKNRGYSELPRILTKYIPGTRMLYEIKDGKVAVNIYPRLEKIIKNFDKDVKPEKQEIYMPENNLPW